MVLPGYGGDQVLPGYHARFGYATLNLFPRGQGESINHWRLDRDTKATYNVTDREHYYYRGAFADCIRGLDYLCSRPDIDRSRLAVWGASQGGGLALATAALDNRPKAVVAALPWLCNFPVSVNLTTSPYKELNDYVSHHPHEFEIIMDKCLKIADYVGSSQRIETAKILGKLRGIGVSTTVDPSAGPSPETAELRFDPGGTVTVLVGSTAGGQSHETIYTQIVSERLGIEAEDIRVIEGDTETVSYTHLTLPTNREV